MRKFLVYGGLSALWIMMIWGLWKIAIQQSVQHALLAVVFGLFASMIATIAVIVDEIR